MFHYQWNLGYNAWPFKVAEIVLLSYLRHKMFFRGELQLYSLSWGSNQLERQENTFVWYLYFKDNIHVDIKWFSLTLYWIQSFYFAYHLSCFFSFFLSLFLPLCNSGTDQLAQYLVWNQEKKEDKSTIKNNLQTTIKYM